MTEIIEQSVSFPTVIFTVPLIFCLLWFLIGFVASGFDVGDGDFDLDLDGDGDIDAFEHVVGALHLSALGLPLSLLMLSFGGWAVSLLISVAATNAGVSAAVVVLLGLVLGLAAGFLFVWKVGGSLGRALTTEQGAERSSAIGCLCKVRTTRVTSTFGDAEVLSGPMKSSIIRVRAEEGQFQRGDVALLVELDDEHDAYWIAEIEEQYRPSV
jgi:hypothetical protein